MQIESVNVGRVGTLQGPSFEGTTGIFKTPAAGPVEVGEYGLTGEIQEMVNVGRPGHAMLRCANRAIVAP